MIASGENVVIMRLTYLYLTWIQAKQWDIEQRPPTRILDLARSVVEFFRFRRFLREVLRGWEPGSFMHIPINYDTDQESQREALGLPPLAKAEPSIQGRYVFHVYTLKIFANNLVFVLPFKLIAMSWRIPRLIERGNEL